MILVLRQGTLDEIRKWVKSNVDLTQQRFETDLPFFFVGGNKYHFYKKHSKKNASGKVLLSCRSQPGQAKHRWKSVAG